MKRRWLGLALAGPAVSACTAGGSSSPPEPAVRSTPAVSETSAQPAGPVSPPSTGVVAPPEALIGTWVADLDDVLAELSPYAGHSPDCAGSLTVTFAADRVFSYAVQAMCGGGSGRSEVTSHNSGQYQADAQRLSVPGLGGEVSVTVDGRLGTLHLMRDS